MADDQPMPARVQRQARGRALAAAVAALAIGVAPLTALAADGSAGGSGGVPGGPPAPPAQVTPVPALDGLATRPAVADPDVGRSAVPGDVHDVALGCYELTSAVTGQPLGRSGEGWAASGVDATPLHLEPTRLAHYLLFGADETLLAAGPGPAEQAEDLLGVAEDVGPVSRDTQLPRSLVDSAPPVLDLDELPDLPETWSDQVVAADTPSPGADWRLEQVTGGFRLALPAAGGALLTVAEDGTLTLVDASAADPDSALLTLRTTDGCATWPEVELNVSGPVLAGPSPWAETRGTIDAHLHLMAFEFLGGRARCGQPWHPYGVTFALADCPSHLAGFGTALEAGVGDGSGSGSDRLWPEFTAPRHSTLTYEQVYHRWLERAWRGGLRTLTVLLVDNNVLCEAIPYKQNSCNEMDAVRLQAQRVREFEQYVDARSGGPGEGWFRVVTDPFEAREVVNDGKLAVVLGIEVSVLFDCRELQGTSQCSDQQILDQLDEVRALGVTQMELVNKFDNALSGVKGDAGQTGTVVNQGNLADTGHYWRMDTCPQERDHGTDRRQTNVVDEAQGTPLEEPARDPLAAQVLSATGTSGATLLYPAGPHCNTAGLTAQGAFLLREMAARGMVFDPDHMSAIAQMQALDVMEELGHQGLVSSHGWGDDLVYERVLELGGVVTPYAGGSAGFVAEWRKHRQWIDERFYFGFGYGADTNGFGAQGGPRDPAEGEGVAYPFTLPGGVVVDQQVSGERAPYDIDTDGVAHYGLYPDWIEDLRVQAGEGILVDMYRGPEAYLQMWERALGVTGDACRLGAEGDPTAEVRRGMDVVEVLRSAGQPNVRGVEGFRYCATFASGPGSVEVLFADDGTVERIVRSDRPVAPPAGNPGGPPSVVPAAAPDGEVVPARTAANAPAHGQPGHVHVPDEADVAAAGTTAAAPPAPGGGAAALLALLGAAGVLVAAQRRRT